MNIKVNKNNIKIKKSFIMLCLKYFIICFLLVIVILTLAYNIVDNKMTNAFPGIDNIIVYKDELENDRYSDIPLWKFGRCAFIIFGNDGEMLYSSNKGVSNKILYSDLEKIPDYNEIYYENPSKFIYEKNLVVEKSSYKNVNGQDRILVMVSPKVTYDEYLKVVNQSNIVWACCIPFTAVVIFAVSFFFARKVKKSIDIINNTISSYSNNSLDTYDEYSIPYEFMAIVDNHKKLIKEIEKSQAEKERIYKENQRIIADLSHDLKTPLTVIQGYSKAFIDGKIPQGQEDYYHQAIFNKAELSNELMDTLFDYIRLEHPSFELHTEKCDFCEFLRNVIADKYWEIENKGFKLELDITEEPIYISLDKMQFKRVIENLINNTIEYNPSGTTIYVSLSKNKYNVVLTMADDGVGIPDNIRRDVFKPFITSNNSRLSEKGTGFGLSIVKKIVELHNGKIKLLDKRASRYSTEFKIVLDI